MPRHVRIARSALLAALAAGALLFTACGGPSGSVSAGHPGHATTPASTVPPGAAADEEETAFVANGTERRFFLQSELVVWNYAPAGRNRITDAPFTEEEAVFTVPSAQRIGSVFDKCIFRQYTDASMTTPVAQPPWMGLLGPTLHAEVGDRVTLVLRNTCSFPTSFHVHGLAYDKASEGATYADGDASRGDAIDPGDSYTYHYTVPPRSGPGSMEGSSASWMYHSHVDEVADVYAGLSGFLVVTRAGMARPDGSPADVDQEVFSLFEVIDESATPLLEANMRRAGITTVDDPDDFAESNLKHAINGYLYGNGPEVELRAGTRVRWTLMSMGNEVDLHTPHWHGMTAEVMGMRTDVVSLLPAEMAVADIVADEPGAWLFHCHVNDHLHAGMVSRVQVIA